MGPEDLLPRGPGAQDFGVGGQSTKPYDWNSDTFQGAYNTGAIYTGVAREENKSEGKDEDDGDIGDLGEFQEPSNEMMGFFSKSRGLCFIHYLRF